MQRHLFLALCCAAGCGTSEATSEKKPDEAPTKVEPAAAPKAAAKPTTKVDAPAKAAKLEVKEEKRAAEAKKPALQVRRTAIGSFVFPAGWKVTEEQSHVTAASDGVETAMVLRTKGASPATPDECRSEGARLAKRVHATLDATELIDVKGATCVLMLHNERARSLVFNRPFKSGEHITILCTYDLASKFDDLPAFCEQLLTSATTDWDKK